MYNLVVRDTYVYNLLLPCDESDFRGYVRIHTDTNTEIHQTYILNKFTKR